MLTSRVECRRTKLAGLRKIHPYVPALQNRVIIARNGVHQIAQSRCLVSRACVCLARSRRRTDATCPAHAAHKYCVCEHSRAFRAARAKRISLVYVRLELDRLCGECRAFNLCVCVCLHTAAAAATATGIIWILSERPPDWSMAAI